MFEEARRQKPVCSMALSWCFNEPWPNAANNSLLSWPDKPKPSLKAVGDALRPVLASARIPKFSWEPAETFTSDLYLLNDSPEKINEGRVDVFFRIANQDFFLLGWDHPGIAANLNLPGPTLRFLLPNIPAGPMELCLKVKDHPNGTRCISFSYVKRNEMCGMNGLIQQTRQQITEIGRLLFDRFLTDAAGGNVSARAGDVICITPRYSGSKYQWRLRPEQVLVTDLDGNKLDGEGEISREARVHMRLYKEFPEGMAVVHSHPRNVMVFATAGQPIPPVWEGTLKFGEIKVCKFAPAHSPDLAEQVYSVMRGQETALRKQAISVIAPAHGLFTLGKTLAAAYDATEQLDGQAYSILMSKFLPDGPVDITAISHDLIAVVARWEK